jgi:predicted transcriptional regulator
VKRDRMEIIGSILSICKNGAKKTEIVYKSNLNFKNGETYLKWLIDRELVSKEERFYRTTPNGAKLLTGLQSASTLMDMK